MIVTLVGCVAILLFAFLGYRRGLLRILAFFVALLVAGLLAAPFSRFALALVEAVRFVPRTLVPLASLFAAGLAVFIALTALTGWLLSRRERAREAQNLPRTEPWERLCGALCGAVWGGALFILVLTGFHFLGTVEQALARFSDAEMPRSETPLERPSPRPADTSAPAAPAPAESAAPGIALRRTYGEIQKQIDASPFAAVVRTVNPAEDRIARTFADLATVTADPVLLDRFQRHPTIFRLTGRPELLQVSQDNHIRELVEERRYYELLDHPKIAALLQDKAFVAECRKVDLEAVLAEVLRRPPPAGTPSH